MFFLSGDKILKGVILFSMFFSILIISYNINIASAAPDTLYVNDSSGNDANDGTSWDLPKKTIKNATETISTNGQIHIADGQYIGLENNNITINRSMSLIGESESGTIINGTGTNWLFLIYSNINVFFYNLTITNGNNTMEGGAVINHNANCTFNNCIFQNSKGDLGGAIWNAYGFFTLNNCIIQNNTATDYGGGIYAQMGTWIINDCIIRNNIASINGGGIYNHLGNFTIINSNITGDYAGNAGGGICNSGTCKLLYSNLAGNVAMGYGSDVYCGGAIFNAGNCELVNCNITDNAAPGFMDYPFGLPTPVPGFGGGIDNIGTLKLTNCSIARNSAGNGGFGGGISNDGNLEINGSIIQSNNVDGAGGGIIVLKGSCTINNSTITQNTATGTYSLGAGFYIDNDATCNVNNCNITKNDVYGDRGGEGGGFFNFGNLEITDSTIRENIATNNGGGIANNGQLSPGICKISDCTIQNNKALDSDGGGGGIDNEYGTFTLLNSMILNNTAQYGGGVINFAGSFIVHFSRFYENNAVRGKAMYFNGGNVDLTENWWDSNNPDFVNLFYGTNEPDNWIYMTINVAPTVIDVNQNSTIMVSFNNLYYKNNGTITPLDPSIGHIPDYTPISFTSNFGNVTGSQSLINGLANATFTSDGYSGLAIINATVDNQRLTVNVTVNKKFDIYVATNGSDTSGNGSPQKPYQTLLRAIDQVRATGTVHVAPGKYAGTGNRRLTIDKEMTILEWEGQSGDIIISGENLDIIFVINPGINVLVQNLTLTNGYSINEGGAILNQGNLTLNTCNITNNKVTYGAGGIYNTGTLSYLNINNCTIQNNKAIYGGGGIYNTGSENSLNIINCNITNNSGTYGAGGIYNTGIESSLNIIGCSITDNKATMNGGGIANYDGFCTIIGCTFSNNTANTGSAIYTNTPNTQINFNRILNNTGINDIFSDASGVNANNNWWATNFQGTNPETVGRVNSNVNATRWIILTLNSNPSIILNGTNSNITADLTQNNLGPSGGFIADKFIIVNFSTSRGLGTLNPSSGNTINGVIRSLFSATGFGTEQIRATVDGYTVSKDIIIQTPTKIIVSNASGFMNQYVEINANLTDYFGNPLTGKNVTITIGNELVDSLITINGKIVLKYRIIQNVGTYNIHAVFKGDNDYIGSFTDPDGILNVTQTIFNPSISADGRYVAFQSAANLVPGLDNGYINIFVNDTKTGLLIWINRGIGGVQSNGNSYNPQITPNGRYITFESDASNLVAGDTNGFRDIFVVDGWYINTVLISSRGGPQTNNNSYNPQLSPDGRYFTFESDATNLVQNDTNGFRDIFVVDGWHPRTVKISGMGEIQANGNSYNSQLSPDGRYFSFESDASNLVAGDTNGFRDIFVVDGWHHITVKISGMDGIEANNNSYKPKINSNGRYIVFESDASNLVQNDTNGFRDIFVVDGWHPRTVKISGIGGIQANGNSYNSQLSPDGRYFTFESDATNLVQNDTNGFRDIFVVDGWHSKTIKISGIGEIQANGNSYNSQLTPNARYFSFESEATNLVPDISIGREVYKVDGWLSKISKIS